MSKNTKKKVLMICTAGRGGMLSVVEGYKADGLFDRWNIEFLSSHVEGGLTLRLVIAMKAFLRLIGLLITKQVKLVHCHSAMRSSFWRKSLLALTSRFFGVPVIFHLHGSEMKPFVEAQPYFLKRLIAWSLKKQSVVIVLSKSWLSYVKSISPMANVKIIPNYVELPDLNNRKKHTPDEDIVVLFLGLLGKRKGIYDLLPAFKDALQHVPSLRLIIGGNGEVKQVQNLITQLNIDKNAELVGWVSGDLKADLLSRAQIFVLPSYNEGLPVSLLEAMSWQVPVITTRVGGIPEQVRDGLDGVLIDPGDCVALSSAIVELASSDKLRQKMGKSAREHVESKYSKDIILPKLDGLYRSLIFPE